MATLDPILWRVITKAAELLSLVRAGDAPGEGTQGYYFDWNPCNIFDGAHMKPGPNADFYVQDEESLDEEGGNNAGLHDNNIIINVEVTYVYDTPPAQPMLTGQLNALKCGEDLKRFFEVSRDALGAEGAFDIYRPRSPKAQIEYSQDKTRPAKLIMPWRIAFSQQRISPELFG